jgi:hypothetical protein
LLYCACECIFPSFFICLIWFAFTLFC